MPFVSDKQRRYLYSQKPEVAKKFAEHHAEGGRGGATSRALKNIWGDVKQWATEDSKKASPMQIRNQQWNNYVRAGSPGKFQDWVDETGGGPVNTEGKSFAESAGDVADFLPVIGDARSIGRAYDAAKEGNWGDAALEAGTTAAGWIPVAGPLARGALRGAKNIDTGIAAVRTLDPDYAKLFAKDVLGQAHPPARSVGASANFGPVSAKRAKHVRAGDKPERILGSKLPKNDKALLKQYEDAAAAIADDAVRVRQGAAEVGAPSTIWSEFQPGRWGKTPTGEKVWNNPQDLVRYELPPEDVFKQHFPDVPYPQEAPLILTTPPRGAPDAPHQAFSGSLPGHTFNAGNRNDVRRSIGQRMVELPPSRGPLADPSYADAPLLPGIMARRKSGELPTPENMGLVQGRPRSGGGGRPGGGHPKPHGKGYGGYKPGRGKPKPQTAGERAQRKAAHISKQPPKQAPLAQQQIELGANAKAQAIADKEAGMTAAQIAEKYGISKTQAKKLGR